MHDRDLPVVVIGAGPMGLAAAAHLDERGIRFVVFERGGDVAASVGDWGHVRLFSPWAMNIDPTASALLTAAGWTPPDPREYPTGAELVARYLHPLASSTPVKAALRMNHRVIGVSRHGIDKRRATGRAETPFVVTTEHDGGVERSLARAVIDASGTWRTPNPIGTDGRFAPGEIDARRRISYGIPDVLGSARGRFVGRRVAVIGSGHSARHVVRDLARLGRDTGGGEVVWVTRRAGRAALTGHTAGDALPERARLAANAHELVAAGAVELELGFGVDEVTDTAGGVGLTAVDGRRIGPFDEIVATTGFRPDLALLAELRVDVDPGLESARALAPLIDPNVHDCGSVPVHGAAELAHPEPGLFVVGAKSYGRAPTFLLSTGYSQVRSVVAAISGDARGDAIPVHAVPAAVCGPEATGSLHVPCSAQVGGNIAPAWDDVACCG
jgi:thioredoxin reductase